MGQGPKDYCDNIHGIFLELSMRLKRLISFLSPTYPICCYIPRSPSIVTLIERECSRFEIMHMPPFPHVFRLVPVHFLTGSSSLAHIGRLNVAFNSTQRATRGCHVSLCYFSISAPPVYLPSPDPLISLHLSIWICLL